MKTLTLIFFLTLNSIISAQTVKISLKEVGNYVGQTVTVCEMVKSTFQTIEHKNTLLNIGDFYPDQKLTIIILERHLKNFSYIPVEYLNGKSVCVTGEIYLYKGKPQIKVKNESQIVIQ
jgi:DNA/RNA endonuclease YhcR with UshA esterase domain